jgi:hypothetical protein
VLDQLLDLDLITLMIDMIRVRGADPASVRRCVGALVRQAVGLVGLDRASVLSRGSPPPFARRTATCSCSRWPNRNLLVLSLTEPKRHADG